MSTNPPPSGSRLAPSALLFLDLADIYELRDEPKMRDRFFILAADAAFAAGQAQEAERLLQRLLQFSPHHMLKGYRTFAEAVRAEPVRVYLADLKQNYPHDVAQTLLESLRGRTVPVETMKATLPPTTVPQKLEPPPDLLDPDRTAILPPQRLPTPARPAKSEDPPTERLSIPRPPSSGTRPPSSAARAPVPPPSTPRARPAPAALSVPRTKPRPLAPPRRRRNLEPNGGGWLAMLLFIVVFIAGLALLGYGLVRPFLP
jgi:hypothetical protein